MTKEEAQSLSAEESLRITQQQGWTGGHNPWVVALVVTMATFMEVLDTAIANVSLPHIAGSLSVSPDESTWVLTSYLVSNAVVLPISGWIANRIGRKRFYVTCVFLFSAASGLSLVRSISLSGVDAVVPLSSQLIRTLWIRNCESPFNIWHFVQGEPKIFTNLNVPCFFSAVFIEKGVDVTVALEVAVNQSLA